MKSTTGKQAMGVFLSVILLFSTSFAQSSEYNFVYDDSQYSSSKEEKEDEGKVSSSERFIDQWILNGGALGSAIGSIIGCFIFQPLIPGPVGLVFGTVVGGLIGSLIGNYIDDRIGVAINYSSFDRPPVTKGGMWLEDVGPKEQLMYQIDAWVINGGSIGANLSHIGLSLLARSVPGVGAWLSPIVIGVADYVMAVIGDNIDGTVDLGSIGKKWDEEDKSTEDAKSYGESYEKVIEEMQEGTINSQRDAYSDYLERYDSRSKEEMY